MNNHGIICKNNTMIIFIVFLIIVSLIFLNKKVIINIDLSTINFEYNFCINIKYFFDVVTLYKEDILKYINKLRKREKKEKQNYKWIFKYINVDRINFDTKIGLGDTFVTSLSIPVVSTFFAIILERYFSKSSKRFDVKPVYNEFLFCLKGTVYLSLKLKDVIYIIFKVLSKQKNKIK